MAKIQDRVKQLRKYLNLSQEELAIETNSKRTTLAGYETGISLPPADFLSALNQKFRINTNWVLTGEGNMIVENSTIKESPIDKEIKQIIKGETSEQFTALEARIAKLEQLAGTATVGEDGYPPDTGDGVGFVNEAEAEYGADNDDQPKPDRVLFVEDTAAGLPIEQSSDRSQYIDVPHRYIKGKAAEYYAARVVGQSMTQAGIPDGSIALFRRADVPVDGAIMIAVSDGKSTLKRLRQEAGGAWRLCYEDGTGRYILAGADFLVQGAFVALVENSVAGNG